MKRALFSSLVAVGLVGCGDDGKQVDTTGSTNSMTGILTLPGTTSEPTTTTTATDPTTTTVPTGTAGPTTDTDTGNTTFDPNDCGEAVVDIPVVTPNVMLVLDKSGSMVTPDKGYWDHDGDDANDDGIQDADPMMMAAATPKITRWKSLYSVVDFITGTFENSMNLGAVLFPSKMAASAYNATACPVNMTPEVEIAPMNGQAILNAIPGADETDATIKGGTPATKGVKAALAELATIQDGQPQFIILVTDGAANCREDAANNAELFEQYDENLSMVVGDAFTNLNIPTYVVGIAIKDETSPTANDGNPDNTNAFQKLNELADIGGRPREGDVKFYDTQNQVELQMALEEISMQILSCTITLDPVPKYPDYVEVSVNGTAYGNTQVASCDGSEDGWMFTTPDKNEIILCGKACSDFQMSGVLDAQYRCPNSG
ncbi:von Willebrand factor type A domain-containing protein [Nannocystis exedens]|uniref:von Willebrand factor type A domain-containing protein n=1 Tax=Nannocystis exedens TaxID=54 RepID=A0A1I1UK79_9BACT|nr:VWA domain-containing protein [Nannocystis exedens]PCC71644.1 von Willebrand factor type A domain protein [Nannocystis exedens]SFD69153.1 von Willebrand factor type A domain-containing protein [Nannocystis exedens]